MAKQQPGPKRPKNPKPVKQLKTRNTYFVTNNTKFSKAVTVKQININRTMEKEGQNRKTQNKAPGPKTRKNTVLKNSKKTFCNFIEKTT